MADMLRADCKAACIDPKDNGRGKIGFHSLRHTTASLLAASGAHPKVAQSIMRHSVSNSDNGTKTNTPGRIRTCDLRIRNPEIHNSASNCLSKKGLKRVFGVTTGVTSQ